MNELRTRIKNAIYSVGYGGMMPHAQMYQLICDMWEYIQEVEKENQTLVDEAAPEPEIYDK